MDYGTTVEFSIFGEDKGNLREEGAQSILTPKSRRRKEGATQDFEDFVFSDLDFESSFPDMTQPLFCSCSTFFSEKSKKIAFPFFDLIKNHLILEKPFSQITKTTSHLFSKIKPYFPRFSHQFK